MDRWIDRKMYRWKEKMERWKDGEMERWRDGERERERETQSLSQLTLRGRVRFALASMHS